MSHTTRIQTELKDHEVLASVVQELGWEFESEGSAELYDGSVHRGALIRIPDWHYPVIVKDNGQMRYDNYNGAWGRQSDIATLKTEYGVAMARKVYGRGRVQRMTTKAGLTKLVITR